VYPPESIEYASRAALLADTAQDTGATGYAPSYAAPTMVRQGSGTAWRVVLELWDGVTAGQEVADLATTPGVENGAVWFTDTGTLYLYDGAAWVESAGSPDGTLTRPYLVTGADYAAVQTALAALSPSDGDFAIAYITGGAEYLLEFVAADTAWYAPDGGDGSQLSPYWTTTASGSGALASLPIGAADNYAVIAKGTGSPVTVRCRAITATTSGYVVTVWVPAAVYALGAPSTSDVVARYPDPARFAITLAGGSVAENSGTVLLTNGASAATIVQTTASRSTATQLAFFATGFAVGGVTATSTQALIRVNSSSDSGQILVLEWGGSGSPGGQTTKLNAYNSSGTRVDTGVLLSSLTYWCATLDVSSNTLTIYSDGASVYSASSVITSADSYRAKYQGQSTIVTSTIRVSTLCLCAWA
jgi:hypothetical protein